MSNFRSTSVLVATSAVLGFSSLAAYSMPITGIHNNHPNNGLAVRNGLYTVNKNTEFKGNGTEAISSGLDVTRSRVVNQGGDFSENNIYGILAKANSQIINNGGLFRYNYAGILADKSQVVVNSGYFSNVVDLFLRGKSTALINGGEFHGTYGITAQEGSSVNIKNGRFEDCAYAVDLYDANQSFISGGTVTNVVYGVFVCSSKATVSGGLFERAGYANAVVTTHESGGPSTLKINGGLFRYGNVGGCLSITPTSRAIINGGTFRENGYYGNELLIGFYPMSGGLVIGGGQGVVNGGTFTANDCAGVQAFYPNSLVTINGGDFRSNGRLSPGSDFGAYIHSGASAVINGGDFSDNRVGLNLGLGFAPSDWQYPSASTATITGGTFHNNGKAVAAQSGSTCEISGGDFNAFRNVSVTGFDTVVRISGGKFQSELYDFDCTSGGTIELTGNFEGFEGKARTVVLTPESGQPPLINTLHGQLKNSTKPQDFKYRVTQLSKLILHITGTTKSAATSSVKSS